MTGANGIIRTERGLAIAGTRITKTFRELESRVNLGARMKSERRLQSPLKKSQKGCHFPIFKL
jgi:hypothetical protein